MADYTQADDPKTWPRYAGLPTFMRAPWRPELEGVEIGIAGVPFDGGVTNRSGARHGPRELRNQSSMMRKYNQATGIGPHALASVADVGDAWVRHPYHAVEESHADIEAFFRRLHAARVVPLAAGGDHSISLPILRAIGGGRPVGMVHIDAHCDTGTEYLGSRFHHGAPFSRAVEAGVLDPKRTIQIGIRGTLHDLDLWRFSHESGMRVMYMEECVEAGVKGIVAEAKRVVGDGPTYLSFDIDALDPAFAPGTGTPESGGFDAREALAILRGLRGIDFVGGDLVEVAPSFDPSGNTALLGASVMFEILCLLAEALATRRGG